MHHPLTRSRCSALLVLAGLALGACAALAQSWPARPIQMVVPYPPGGVDRFTRVMAPGMSEALGQPIVIENRGGANGTIGAELVARAAPDGYTLLFAAASTVIGAVKTMKGVKWDPIRDFTPISRMYDNLRIITVSAALPVKSLRELIEHAKRNPGKLSFGSSGIGSSFHLDGEILAAAAGIQLVHVPYKGTGPMLTDLVAGRVEVGLGATSSFEPHVASGKLRPVAIFEPRRYARYPDVPTVAEVIPGARKSPSWIALMAPAGLQRPIVQRLHAAVVAGMATREARAYFESTGTEIIGGSPEDLAKTIPEDLAAIGALLDRLGIRPE